MLANILRTGRAAHRPLPADTGLAQAIAVLARAQQDAVWDRTTPEALIRTHSRYFKGLGQLFRAAVPTEQRA